MTRKGNDASSAPGRRNKYNALGEYLYQSGQGEVMLHFDRIKDILGFDLPPSASKYRAWWANGGHTQSDAWMGYGYEVAWVNEHKQEVRFRKMGEPVKVPPAKAVGAKADAVMPVNPDADTITVCGYDFTYIQDIKPERDSDGKIVEYAPQSRYSNSQGKRLHYYGSGTFCRFSIDAGNWPGVYLWVVDGEIIYIGETVKLGQRFNMGYGRIEGVNCYEGGQMTNCKMNKVVLELTGTGKTIKLYFLNTQDYKRVELELLRAVNTKYNVKDNT